MNKLALGAFMETFTGFLNNRLDRYALLCAQMGPTAANDICMQHCDRWFETHPIDPAPISAEGIDTEIERLAVQCFSLMIAIGLLEYAHQE